MPPCPLCCPPSRDRSQRWSPRWTHWRRRTRETCQGRPRSTGLAEVLAAETAVDEHGPEDTAAWRAAAEDEVLAGLPPEDWPTARPAPRGRLRRAHDALRAALRRLLDTAVLGRRDKATPHLLLTVSLDQLRGQPGALPARGLRGSRPTRRQLRTLLCDAVLTRIVLDAGRRVLEASHPQRTLTALERHVLHTSGAGGADALAAPGGLRRATGSRRTTPTRTTARGRRALADTVPLCEQDHHHLHHHRRVLRLADGWAIGPDGWVLEEPG